jgi:hypothetical protein
MKHLKTFNESENMFTTIKRMYKKKVGDYEEPIYIYITIFDKTGFIKNEWMDTKVNKYLMELLDNNFNLNFINGSVNKLDVDKISEIKNFLINKVGLQFMDFSNKNRKEYCFKGKMSVNELKNK